MLHPAAHEEPALHLPVFDELFARCRGFAFHSRSERALVNERFGVAATPQVLIGLGVEEPAGVRRRRRMARPRRAAFGVGEAPYLLCIGRVDDQKGTGMLWRWFRAYKERHPGPLRLVFVGQVVDPPDAGDGRRRDRHGRRRGQVGACCAGRGRWWRPRRTSPSPSPWSRR